MDSKSGFLLALTFFIICLTLILAVAVYQKNQIESLNEEIKTLNEEKETLKRAISACEGKKSSCLSELNNLKEDYQYCLDDKGDVFYAKPDEECPACECECEECEECQECPECPSCPE
jgi:2-hydroxy-3-keto-5-methylthiopentenyl-1-phosphate phosphatase